MINGDVVVELYLVKMTWWGGAVFECKIISNVKCVDSLSTSLYYMSQDHFYTLMCEPICDQSDHIYYALTLDL
jgi:hypothetical protein